MGAARQQLQFPRIHDQRMHDFRLHAPSAATDRDRRLENRPDLHLEDLRISQRDPAAPVPEHRVRLVQPCDTASQHVQRNTEPGGELPLLFFTVWSKLMQRRVDQSNRDRSTFHRIEDPLEITPLNREQGLLTGTAIDRHDHLLDRQAPLLGVKEHMFGAAQADPLGPHFDRLARVVGGVDIGAHPQRSE